MSYIETALEAASVRERLRNPPNARLDSGIDLKRISHTSKLRFMSWASPEIVEFEKARVEARPPICISIEDKGGFDDVVPVILKPASVAIIPTPFTMEARALYPTVGMILQETAKFYCVSVIDMLSDRRTADIVRPRHVCMFLAKELTLRSLPYIAKRLGDKDHTTILHAVNKIKSLCEKDERLRDEIHVLTLNIAARRLILNIASRRQVTNACIQD